MRKYLVLATLSVLLGCNSSPSTDAVARDGESRPGAQEHMILSSKVDGEDISFEFYEPDEVVAGQTYPLVLHGHGYGGARQTSRDGFIGRLTAAGYYVISIDQRGFGDAGGTSRGMSPDFEGQDLIAILDWAEELPQLARRENGEMLVGSYGGSYGGAYQLILYATDPLHRLRVLAPDITWHNLHFSFEPNGVVKSGYGLALAAAGEQGSQFEQDNAIREAVTSASTTNRFGDSYRHFFEYHSLRYFCEGQPAGEQNFIVATPDPINVPPQLGPAPDVLLTQGMRDVLFNLNEAHWNYQCLNQLGGDVRLLTHESGHILPASLQTAGLEDPLDPFYQAVTAPSFQDTGGARNCGSVNLNDLQFAWFEEKLKGQTGLIDAVYGLGGMTCFSLGTDDAVATDGVPMGGESFAIDSSIPQFNSTLGVAGALLGSGASEALLATQPLFTAPAEGAVLAGIPMLDATVTGLSGFELSSCPTDTPQTGCDPIYWLGLGHRKAGASRWDLIDDQLTPIRGFGNFQLEMTGVAERLQEGDELALLVYGFHAQYPVTWSRDLFVPAATISGTVAVPLLSAAQRVAISPSAE